VSAVPTELDPTLTVVWRALHRRYGASDQRVGSVSVSGLDLAERQALADLLREGELRPQRTRVPTPKLADALGVDEEGLRRLVEAELGPAGNRAADRDAAAQARDEARRRLVGRAGDDELLAGWAGRQAVGIGDELAERVALAEQVLAVVTGRREVPAPLPVVAAETFGDPHALDLDRPAGRMLVGALAERAGLPRVDARTRRRLLRAIGVIADELSSTVAAYRLPVAGDHPLATVLAGPEPAAVSLGQLLRHPLVLVDTPAVRVVENPAVVSAAALRGATLPLVCTSGMPSVAAIELVTQLLDAGCRVLAHADFDAVGLVIVGQLVGLGAEPWRMQVADYQQAAARSTCELESAPAEVAWSPGLAAEMVRVGRVGFEEHLLDRLLDQEERGTRNR
jgi:uncharacterized protein (TIGR02679 family)